MSIMMVLMVGLWSPPTSALVDKHYVRITDPADLPDMKRWSPPSSRGTRIGLFNTAKYGWHPGRGQVSGPGRADAVIARLGPPMRLERSEGVRRGYMWRHKDPAKQHAGIMLLVSRRGSVELRSWRVSDRAQGYTGRVGVAGEDEIYRWFDWLTTPLTAAEAAAADTPPDPGAPDLEGGRR